MTCITPIFKAGDGEEPSNYRPISIWPICMKVFEHVLHSQLYSFVCEYDYLCPNQSGFEQKHSTSTALVDDTDSILYNMDTGH